MKTDDMLTLTRTYLAPSKRAWIKPVRFNVRSIVILTGIFLTYSCKSLIK